MKILEVPVFNDDGSIKFTASVTPEQAQALLEFAYNFLVATGMSVRAIVAQRNEEPLTTADPSTLQ